MRRGTATLAAVLMVAVAGPAAAQVEVTAKKAAAPAVDGKVDKVWDTVRATKVAASEGTQGDVEVSLKVLYTDKEIYFLLQWPDKTMSQNRFWAYDGKDWKAARGGEDQLNLMWDIDGSVKAFATNGCAAACHKQGKQVSLRTAAAGERLDLWQWRAQRTHPAGYADDLWLGHEAKKGDLGEVARQGDSPGGSVTNWDDAAKRPKWAPKGGAKAGPVLLRKDAADAKDQKFKSGDKLPRDVVDKPSGSRGDVQAAAAWSGGRWTLELKRARETADKQHDVQFTDAAKGYLFGLSVHDDAAAEEHSHTSRTVLKLMLK